ncbi:MAG: TonB-dependent receptor, partial [bacterium]
MRSNFRYLLLFPLLLSWQNHDILAQNRVISGHVSDSISGESLIGVNVYVPSGRYGTISNEFGFFSLKIPESTERLYFSFMGYRTDSLLIEKKESEVFLNIKLSKGLELEEVQVKAPVKSFVERNETAVVRIPMKTVYQLPVFLGENDIIHALQLMPGIKSGSEGKANLYIRGGSPDQNLVLLDDVPLYNVNHFGGFLSTFNSDAIKDFKVFKGGFPARYGSRLSSVVDIRMKDGDLRNFKVSGALGMLSSKLMVEGPVIKDRASFLVSFRKNTLPVFRMLFDANIDYHFYDLNAKFNYRLNGKNRLHLSFYRGNDNVMIRNYEEGSGNINDMKVYTAWGNTSGSFRWNSMLSEKIFMNTILGYTRYHYNKGFENYFSTDTLAESVISEFESGINDLFIKFAPEVYITSDHILRFGAELMQHSFSPASTFYEQQKTGYDMYSLSYENEENNALEGRLFFESDLEVFSWLGVNLGIHHSTYHVSEKNYSSLEPRILTNFRISPGLSFKASYSEMQQYVHLLTYSGVGMPSDFWMPS